MEGISTQKRLHFRCWIVYTLITLVFRWFSDRKSTLRPPDSGVTRTKTHLYFTHFGVSDALKCTNITLDSGVTRTKYYLKYTYLCTLIHRKSTYITLHSGVFRHWNTTFITLLAAFSKLKMHSNNTSFFMFSKDWNTTPITPFRIQKKTKMHSHSHSLKLEY